MLERETSEQVLGGFFSVYRCHGYGFVEPVYANSLVVELGRRGLDVKQEVPVEVFYLGVHVGTYRMDLVVNDRILVEVKSLPTITKASERQVLNYLKATRIEVGFLFNFGPDPQFRRLILTNDRK